MIVYTQSLDGISTKNLKGFFIGWVHRPSPTTHLRILEKSRHAILAVDSETGNVVGFVTAHTDGVLSAYIPLLEVRPEFRRQGIGAELVRRMLSVLQPYYAIDLVCDSELQPFYDRLGMRRTTAMTIRRYEKMGGD